MLTIDLEARKVDIAYYPTNRPKIKIQDIY